MTLGLALSVARGGLALLTQQLAQSADNVANAGDAGHTRKTVNGRAVAGDGASAGVRVLPATRDVDEALTATLTTARAGAAAARESERLLSMVEAAHGTPESGESLGGLVGKLRTSLVSLIEAPSETVRQGDLVAVAEAVAGQLNGLSQAVGAARQEAQDALVAEVAAANAAIDEVARLTAMIRNEVAAGRAAPALEDRRDAAIARLAESIGVTALKRGDGGVVLVARGGTVLPLEPGQPVFAMESATVGPDAYHGGAGTLPGIMLGGADVTRRIVGGRLGALVELRDATLPRLQAELDLAAAHLASRFEAQGLALFTGPAGLVPDVTLPYAGSDMVGFASAIRVDPSIAGAPMLGFDTGAATDLGTFSAVLQDLLDYGLGSGPAAGATYPAIASSGLGPDGSLRSPLSGFITLESFSASLVSAQASLRAGATGAAEREEALRELLSEQWSSRSGVDVDREMARMVELQTAYSVNARVVSTVQAMWDSLLSAVR